ncbi:MAG: type II/IV secretion system protein [Chromatiales bacterium]|nr:type II/IV secretion system protein [Chromatiales bacterium]
MQANIKAAVPEGARGGVAAPWPAVATTPEQLAALRQQMRRLGPMRLTEALLRLGKVCSEAVAKASAVKSEHPERPVGGILLEAGDVAEEDIRAGLALQLGIPAIDLRQWPLDDSITAEIPSFIARRHRLIPVHRDAGTLHVAVSDVLDHEALEAVRFRSSLTIEPVYASAADIDWAVERHYHATGRAVTDAELEREGATSLASLDSWREEPLAVSDNVVVRLANQIIAEGCRERASDIHIEPAPGRERTLVRFRVDGRMYVRRSIPWSYRDALISRLKVMASLDVAEHRIPQDGKILWRPPYAQPVELRMVTMPTAGGVEDVVLRILNTTEALPLEKLGLCDEDHGRLRQLIEKPHGILLVCGPTGSGKTTTLHSVIRHLNDGSRKIWTAENPIEITQAGLRQVEIRTRAGLTFATALRAFLRADPDVIMVGEIRDTETAHTALEASLTGHLVLSTLHTNSAPESVVRLLEMGMNPFNFADALLGILAQRLVRCLCTSCREPFEVNAELLRHLARNYLATGVPGGAGSQEEENLRRRWTEQYGQEGSLVLYRARGCPECRQTGYRGRVGLFELMPATPEIKHAIISHEPASQLFSLALAHGMRTLKQDGIHKVLAGRTDLSQVLAVSQR